MHGQTYIRSVCLCLYTEIHVSSDVAPCGLVNSPNIKQLLDQGLHNFSKNLWAISKFHAAGKRHWSTSHAEDPHVSGAIEQNSFVHPCVRTWGRRRYHPPKRRAVQHHIPRDFHLIQLHSENPKPCCALEIHSYAKHDPVSEDDWLSVGEEIPPSPLYAPRNCMTVFTRPRLSKLSWARLLKPSS